MKITRSTVDTAIGPTDIQRLGLLLEWRQVPVGWKSRVVYAAQLRAERWAAVEEWALVSMLMELIGPRD
jgi:hypothetical protein